MGTRGYYCFRYRGKYYIFYNHWDSYPEGLGKTLVSQINAENVACWKEILETLPPTDQKDVEHCRLFLLKFADEVMQESFKETKLSSPLTKDILQSPTAFEVWCDGAKPKKKSKVSTAERKTNFEKLFEALSSATNLKLAIFFSKANISFKPPQNDVFIEWVYIFDLDRQAFTVKTEELCQHFALFKVPTNWEDLLYPASVLKLVSNFDKIQHLRREGDTLLGVVSKLFKDGKLSSTETTRVWNLKHVFDSAVKTVQGLGLQDVDYLVELHGASAPIDDNASKLYSAYSSSTNIATYTNILSQSLWLHSSILWLKFCAPFDINCQQLRNPEQHDFDSPFLLSLAHQFINCCSLKYTIVKQSTAPLQYLSDSEEDNDLKLQIEPLIESVQLICSRWNSEDGLKSLLGSAIQKCTQYLAENPNAAAAYAIITDVSSITGMKVTRTDNGEFVVSHSPSLPFLPSETELDTMTEGFKMVVKLLSEASGQDVQQPCIGDYLLQDVIHLGGDNLIVSVTLKNSSDCTEPYCMKVMSRENCHQQELEAYQAMNDSMMTGVLTLIDSYIGSLQLVTEQTGSTTLHCCIFKECGEFFSEINDPHDLQQFLEDAHDTLEALHRLRWVHQDVKPSNFIRNKGKYLLIDFEASSSMDGGGGGLKYTRQFLYPFVPSGSEAADWASLMLTASYFMDKSTCETDADKETVVREIQERLKSYGVQPPSWISECTQRILNAHKKKKNKILSMYGYFDMPQNLHSQQAMEEQDNKKKEDISEELISPTFSPLKLVGNTPFVIPVSDTQSLQLTLTKRVGSSKGRYDLRLTGEVLPKQKEQTRENYESVWVMEGYPDSLAGYQWMVTKMDKQNFSVEGIIFKTIAPVKKTLPAVKPNQPLVLWMSTVGTQDLEFQEPGQPYNWYGFKMNLRTGPSFRMGPSQSEHHYISLKVWNNSKNADTYNLNPEDKNFMQDLIVPSYKVTVLKTILKSGEWKDEGKSSRFIPNSPLTVVHVQVRITNLVEVPHMSL